MGNSATPGQYIVYFVVIVKNELRRLGIGIDPPAELHVQSDQESVNEV